MVQHCGKVKKPYSNGAAALPAYIEIILFMCHDDTHIRKALKKPNIPKI